MLWLANFKFSVEKSGDGKATTMTIDGSVDINGKEIETSSFTASM